MKRVSRVTPMAPQVAAGQADENAGQSRERGLALNRLEDFRYDHSIEGSVDAPTIPLNILPHFLGTCGQRVVRNCVAKGEFVFRNGLIHVQKVTAARQSLIFVNFL